MRYLPTVLTFLLIVLVGLVVCGLLGVVDLHPIR